MPSEQNYANHARLVPLYHYVLFLILLVNLAWTGYRLVAAPGLETAVGLLLAFGLVLIAFFARAFALKAQDRVIRLEMRLRMREVLPADLAARFAEFRPGQLIALRFASDAELPALARKVLDEPSLDSRAIKQLIKNWQADDLRV